MTANEIRDSFKQFFESLPKGYLEAARIDSAAGLLKEEMRLLKEAILAGKNISEIDKISSHAQWAQEFMKNYNTINEDNIDEIINDEIGKVFAQVLTHAGVYKRDAQGQAAFDRFVMSLNN